MSSSVLRDWPYSIRIAAVLISVVAICTMLYWAQLVLIPLALAGLLTFMLTPVVARLEHWGLARVPAVIAAVTMTALLLGLVGWIVSTQVTTFAAELPKYERNIRDKVSDLRQMFQGGALEKVQSTIDDVKKQLEEEDEDGKEASSPDTADEPEADVEPVPVRTVPEDYLLPDTGYLAPFAQALGVAGLVIVLAFFMLIQREDVLSRLVSLAGQRSLAITTRALDEASRRISRYLLMQFLINSSYGLAVGVGLFFIGVPYAPLWGLSAFVFRYIPYIGPWIGALLPITVSLVHFPGWTIVLIVIGLFVALELFSNNVMEPLLYGQSVGLSAVAVIVAAVFWTWMWGPVGLVLSTPLTVCLVVLGEHIPGLSIFDRMLSDRPALDLHLWLYQRLLAGDEEDAEEIVEKHLEEKGPAATCDELLLPTLLFARRERAGRRIEEDDQQQILEMLKDIVEQLPREDNAAAPPPATSAEESPRNGLPHKVAIVGFPVQPADVLVFQLLERLLDPHICTLEILSQDMLIAERLAAVEERRPAILCLSSLPPGGLRQTRAICKSVRTRHPDLKILVGRWTTRGPSERAQKLFKASGANAVAVSLSQMREVMQPIVQFHRATDPQAPPGGNDSRRERDGVSMATGHVQV